jgi:hypothetical protein
MATTSSSSVDTAFRQNRERCSTFDIGEMVYVDFNRTKTYLGAIVSKSPGIGVVRVIIMDEAFGSNHEVAVPVGCCRKIGIIDEVENVS